MKKPKSDDGWSMPPPREEPWPSSALVWTGPEGSVSDEEAAGAGGL